MCKKKKQQQAEPAMLAEQEVAAPVVNPEPIAPKENDYFNEYYKVYKNDYIEEYLQAYHRYKETGEIDDTMRELQGYDIGNIDEQ